MRLSISILFVATLFSIACQQEPKEVVKKVESKVIHEEQELELAVSMGYLQRYLTKTYFAAQEENTQLHDFYTHELEEVMEKIQEAGIEEDGVNISYNILHYGIKSLETYESRIKEEGFKNHKEHFQNLINGCNSCHMVSKHPFIQIQVPTSNPYTSQKFTP